MFVSVREREREDVEKKDKEILDSWKKKEDGDGKEESRVTCISEDDHGSSALA